MFVLELNESELNESFESGNTKSIISQCYDIMKLRFVGIPVNIPSECQTDAMKREIIRFSLEKEHSSSRDSYVDAYSDDSYGNFYNNPITSRIRNVRFN